MRLSLLRVLMTMLAALLGTHPVSGQVVRGQVVDSVGGWPLAGAIVVLVTPNGVLDTTLADAAGRFQFWTPTPGSYRLRVDAGQDELAVFPQFSVPIEGVRSFMLLVATEPDSLSLLPAPGIVDRVCPRGSDPTRPVIVGAVTRPSGVPAAGAIVTVSWSPSLMGLEAYFEREDVQWTIATSSEGIYAVCNLPAGMRIIMHVVSANDRTPSDFAEVTFVDEGVFDGRLLHQTQQMLWRQDFVVRRPPPVAGVVGSVSDSTGNPIEGVVLRLLGTDLEAQTDRMGAFSFTQTGGGRTSVLARHVAYRPLVREVTLQWDERVDVGRLVLTSLPASLEPIVVEAAPRSFRRDLSEFEYRRRTSVGHFITREEFEETGNPVKTTDVLLRMGSVRVVPNTSYGSGWPNPDIRRWIVSFGRTAGRSGRGSCPPLYFVDRHYLGNADRIDIDSALPIAHIVAVEAYSSAASIPAEFNRPGAACGVIVFWTR